MPKSDPFPSISASNANFTNSLVAGIIKAGDGGSSSKLVTAEAAHADVTALGEMTPQTALHITEHLGIASVEPQETQEAFNSMKTRILKTLLVMKKTRQ